MHKPINVLVSIYIRMKAVIMEQWCSDRWKEKNKNAKKNNTKLVLNPLVENCRGKIEYGLIESGLNS